MKKIINQIPNFITSLNLIAGSLAVIFAIDGHLIWAGVFICFAAIFDFLDGFAARLLKAYSEIGKQLDSLADVISFGLAPGAILFTLLEFALFGKNQVIYEISAQWWEWLILFCSFLIPVFGAIRLAKFNTNKNDESFFRGLPIPANGILWASLGLMLQSAENPEIFKLIYSTKNLLALTIITSGLMIVNLPMFSLKFHSIKLKENWYRYLFISISAVLVVLFNYSGLTYSVLIYIILNSVFYLFRVNYS